ncbi:MAG: asparagine synthase-related protein [Candidatus Rokubacteria bacterium]|nr:asparagine synthase-related protein [Candidatus Rokubacteria bacterium]
MSLIGGLVYRDPTRPVEPGRLSLGSLADPGAGRGTRIGLPGALLATEGEQAACAQWDGAAAAMDHDLTNLDEIRGSSKVEPTIRVLEDGYRRHGARFLAALRGGFALALWWPRSRRLLLAADRFGIRRLYYAATPEGIAFGTRVSVPLALPGTTSAVDPEAVYAYLNYSAIPAPQTVYRAIRRLPPGHLLEWEDGRLRVEPYWDMRYTERAISRTAASASLRRHTEEAVGDALRGADPKHTGAFLSGGTDSSTVVGLMTRLTGERVNAFSIGFLETRYDELQYAELAARHFDAAHYTRVVTADDAFSCLPEVVEAYDEPFGDNSALPTFLCARQARETGMRLILAGDGGDEIFGGNERYRREQILARYRLIPGAIRKGLIEPILGAVKPGRMDVLGKAQRYVGRASQPNPDRFYSTEFFIARERLRLLHPDFLSAVTADAPFRIARRHFDAVTARSELNRLLYVDLKITIGDNDLFKVTRMAELAGIAVRFPMLDPRLVEFTGTLPAWHKVRGTEKRHLFKRAFSTLLPAATLAKVKHGFGLPISDWLRTHGPFRELARDTLLSRRSRERGYFAPGVMEELFRLHEDDRTPFYGDLLWSLLMLELWHGHHGDVA